MKEITLRKYHRTIGIILTLFIFLQIGSGIALILDYWCGKFLEKSQVSTSSAEEDSTFVKILDFIHFKGGGLAGGIYKELL